MINISRDRWCNFVKEYVDKGFDYKMKIIGNSMIPTFQPNDFITVQKKSMEDLQIGDIIIFFSKQKYFIMHRLIKKIKKGDYLTLITKGDNNLFIDKYHITKNNYIGICKCI